MTDAEIRKEFSKATTFPELFSIANRLKQNGESEVKINKAMTVRKNALNKQSVKLMTVTVEAIDTKLDTSETTAVQRIPLHYLGNRGGIRFNGEAIELL